MNYAWGYQDDGIFIDTNGAVYAFDFGMTTLNQGTSDEQLLEKFDIIRDNTEPITMIDSDTIIELYSLGSQIDPESEFHSKNVAMDAGSRTVSFCNPDTGRKTVCTEQGDDEGTLRDSFSQKFVKLYNIKIKTAIPEFTAPLVYTEYDIHLNNEAYGFSETAMREVWKDFDMHGFRGI